MISFVLGFMVNQTSLLALSNPHQILHVVYQKRPKAIFRFSEPKEVFDSSSYQAERFSIYQSLYSFFGDNPINFKSLKVGEMKLHFSTRDGFYQFDSVVNGLSLQNKKVMNLFAKSFSSPAIADSQMLTLSIFIRKSKNISQSLDTFDYPSNKKVFESKTKFQVFEKGKCLNASDLLMKIIGPRQIKKTKNENEIIFVNIQQFAWFVGGPYRWHKYVEENFVVPNECKEEWFDCQIKINFKIDELGRIDSLAFVELKPMKKTSNESLFKAMELELKRLFLRQSKLWKPKTFNGIQQESIYSTVFSLNFED